MDADNQIFRGEYNEREKSSISPCINDPKGRINTDKEKHGLNGHFVQR